jgi:hypothetical protein
LSRVQTTLDPCGNSRVQPPQRVNVSSIAGISIVATTISSGFWQRSQISIAWARAAQSAAIKLGLRKVRFRRSGPIQSFPLLTLPKIHRAGSDRLRRWIPPKDANLLRTLQSERFADYRKRLFTELAGREKVDPSTKEKLTVRPKIEEVEALVGRLAAIDRQEVELYGLNAPKKAEAFPTVTGQAVSDEEIDVWLGRLTPQERETFMMLLAKAQGRWVEQPNIEDQGVSVETTAVACAAKWCAKLTAFWPELEEHPLKFVGQLLP